VSEVHYPGLSKKEIEGAVNGSIAEFVHEPGRGSPLALIRLETGEEFYSVVPEGIFEGQSVEMGSRASVDVGNVIPLGDVPAGTMVCNIELQPGDGGKVARSSGAFATVVAHTPLGTMIKFPSGRTRYIHDLCRAMIGVVSGAGRVDKPFLKAGSRWHLFHAKGHKYHLTRGVAMVAASHPYGSSKRGGRKVTTVARGAPPGKKIGLIAARSTGRKKKRQV
jgi:large subunit ribosomal protein L2